MQRILLRTILAAKRLLNVSMLVLEQKYFFQFYERDITNYSDSSTFSTASGAHGLQYVVLQVTLKEKFIGTGSGNLTELEKCINDQASKGYRLHTITTSNGGSKGLMGGDRIQARMVFEKIV